MLFAFFNFQLLIEERIIRPIFYQLGFLQNRFSTELVFYKIISEHPANLLSYRHLESQKKDADYD